MVAAEGQGEEVTQRKNLGMTPKARFYTFKMHLIEIASVLWCLAAAGASSILAFAPLHHPHRHRGPSEF